ncbi:MAG: penicillin-binding protein 2 [Treponema sp.]|nr:penicillin-binding protein 2 [Treponema sp.]
MASEREGRSEMRIIVLRLMFIAVFALYAMRLFGMQVLRGEVYRARAQSIARQTVTIPAQRGEIFDRSFSQPLVMNANSFTVSITPAEVPRAQLPELISRLAEILGIQGAQLQRRLPATLARLYQPVEIAWNVSFHTISIIAEESVSLPGVSWQSRPVRFYPDIGSLSHIIGYVGNISMEELTVLFNLGYNQGDIIGRSGIERQYDLLLRGKEGLQTRIVDARGRIIADGETRVPPEMGKNLVLTIDRRIQTLAERALGSRLGSVVVLRPTTGEVLAMASYPWYDPNVFNNSDMEAQFQALLNNPSRPLINRAIQATYPPASAFKIAMSTAALAENVFSPEHTIECRGEIVIGDRVFRCHIGYPGHGRVNLQQALAQSCNIYYAVLARDHLGIDNIVHHARQLGFGKLAEVDLPGEASGFVPDPQWKERRFNSRWVGGDTVNMSIGQGYTLVTPLQMANMVAMVVNDGVVFRPHLLKEVRDPRTGELLERTEPEVLHTSTVSTDAFTRLRRDMRSVITEGTARYPMNINAVQIAGKTGTAELGGVADSWHSWFVAYAPYQTPNPEERIVVAVIVEAGNGWEWWAPFASAAIFQGIFANQTFEEAAITLRIPEHRRRG